MIELKIIIGILLIHYLADFILQTDKQARGKSKNWKDLLSHTKMYSFIWLVAGCLYLYVKYQSFTPPRELCVNVLYFTLITFVCHTITDYFTSNEVAKYFNNQNYHIAFVVIGFDQFLHYAQLFLTYYLLIL